MPVHVEYIDSTGEKVEKDVFYEEMKVLCYQNNAGEIKDLQIRICSASHDEPGTTSRRIVNLVRHRVAESECYISSFNVEDDVDNVEQALRDAVNEFLSTDFGAKVIIQNNGHFNWGDAILYVPEFIWSKHGLHSIRHEESVDIIVDHDEELCNI